MNEIHLLDTDTIDKIAAGEVVERPSSVVKELVENAIDAGADVITVEIKEGGIAFIRVTDNGSGIDKSQIEKAFIRHATSKIRTVSDLTNVVSLGFRGEALSSIAAVAMVEMITKTKTALTGVRNVIEGAVQKELEDIGAPDGTTIIVRNLFFNTPVRRKFLKQPMTEGGYVSDLMEHMALSNPNVSFKYMVNGQVKFHTTGNGDLKEIIYRIYGRDIANELVEVKREENGMKIVGYLGKPTINRSNRNYENYFVNGRYIKSKLIAKSIEEGYKGYLMQHKYPFTVLHFSIDTEMIDVNVHPTKMDVRFTQGEIFFKFVSNAIADVLAGKEMIPNVVLTEEKEEKKAVKYSVPEPFEVNRMAQTRVKEEIEYRTEQAKKEYAKNPVWSRVLGNAEKYEKSEVAQNKNLATGQTATERQMPEQTLQEKASNEQQAEAVTFFSVDFDEKEEQMTAGSNPVAVQTKENILENTPAELTDIEKQVEAVANAEAQLQNEIVEKPVQLELFEEKILTKEARQEYKVLGQIFDTYWLICYQDKLMIMDQHAAHEKVKYEKFIKALKEKQVSSQMLNPPLVVTMTGQQENVYKEYADVFAGLGFEIEEFGGNEYAVRAVPTDLYGCNEKELFEEVLDELSQGPVRGNATVIEEKIASMSCKAAVKGNMSMSFTEVEALLDQLLVLDNPYNCPHGRPTIISMTKYEIEKKFKRIV